ncbi:TetR/AcrR family transcriptional regulator [Methylorubrum extorquens]|uniref:TetR/AcrR family transcriptional regulator n=1 Tax=Methylorubrum extorquens TaxID=408 RepID=UPI0020A0C12D|nr:TetR/AcrR family transcriptional regulator [Methylorubrum extorquens]MCP1538852.1 TetR/AcrR family transcriptional repressor of nem operon [Methylorubrum extorquens]
MARLAAQTDTRQEILDSAYGLVGAKGFSGVGLNEILTSAGVPKGSFYHYFGSKEAFGEALLADYFKSYLADLDTTLAEPGLSHAEHLMNYWRKWQATQGSIDDQRKCLAVKLAAEVSDLSEPMRLALKSGTAAIIERLARSIAAGVAEGSLTVESEPHTTAEDLYHVWLGASLMAKIVRTDAPFEAAIGTTRRILGLTSH